MFGGPILFLLIAFFGLRALVGPGPVESPVQKLRNGAVSVGMREDEVLSKIGRPKSATERPEGGFTYRYQRSSWDNQRSTMLEEDAYVDFSAGGTVTGITFEARTPPINPGAVGTSP